jgi:hypothetical protein
VEDTSQDEFPPLPAPELAPYVALERDDVVTSGKVAFDAGVGGHCKIIDQSSSIVGNLVFCQISAIKAASSYKEKLRDASNYKAKHFSSVKTNNVLAFRDFKTFEEAQVVSQMGRIFDVHL